MYINPKTFSKVFQEYCDKVHQKKAEQIPYDSWQFLHRLDMNWPKEINNNDLYWESSLSFNQDASPKITISYIYGTDATVEIDIPNEFYTDLIKKSTLIPSSLHPSSCCINTGCCDNTITTTSATTSINDLLSNLHLTSPELSEGSLFYNQATGSLSYVCDGQLNKVPTEVFSSNSKINEEKEKENDTMNIPTMRFDFGPANADAVAMSPYGLAIHCGDSWYAYNTKDSQTIDVTGMTFSFKNAIYKMPVAVNQVKEGDLIIHQKKAMYVVQVNDKTSIEVIDLAASEQKTVIPVSNMFGFNYVTKVTPLFNLGNIVPSAENPFGNILPMMMMSSMFEDGKDNKSEGNDFMQMMLMMSLMNGANPFSAMFAGAGSQVE